MPPSGEGAPGERLFQLHGRAKGKALRQAQQGRIDALLPKLALAPASLSEDPARIFGAPIRALWLEIGFGGGEHLAAIAKTEPQIGFLGAEPFLNGVAKLLAAIEADDLANIRVLRGDGRDLLAALPEASLERVYLLYPDPWPKRRQRKRRIVSDDFVAMLARVIKPGGEFRFASDIDDYVGWTLARLLRNPRFDWLATKATDWRDPWPGWVGTRYEAKALREGRKPSYLRFLRRDAG